jgi:hypothetical protein
LGKYGRRTRKWSGVHIDMPHGFTRHNKALKLKKSLHQLKQSPCNFLLHFNKKLESIGLKSSISDQCLFISSKVACLVYVNDTLFFAENEEDITEAIDGLVLIAPGVELEVKEDVAGFFGVHIDHQKYGSIHQTQTGLIA